MVFEPADVIRILHGEIARVRAAVPADLIAGFDDLVDRRGYLGADPAPFFNPLGHPLFELPQWAAASDPSVPTGVLEDLIGSSLWGYLHVRLQDDRLDEGIGEEAEVLLLGDLLLTRHQALVARHVRAREFWDRFEELWAGYAGAMALERRLIEAGGYGEAEFDALLARSQPLEIPAAAVLAVRSRWDDTAALGSAVRSIVRSGQLVNDLIGAMSDHDHGMTTWLMRRFEGDGSPEELRRGIVMHADVVVGEAERDLAEADRAFEVLGWEDGRGWIGRRRRAMRQLLDELYGALFAGLSDRNDPRGEESSA